MRVNASVRKVEAARVTEHVRVHEAVLVSVGRSWTELSRAGLSGPAHTSSRGASLPRGLPSLPRDFPITQDEQLKPFKKESLIEL